MAWPSHLSEVQELRKRTSVPNSAMLAVIPFIAAIILVGSFESLPAKAILIVVGLSLMSAIHMLWVPLERR